MMKWILCLITIILFTTAYTNEQILFAVSLHPADCMVQIFNDGYNEGLEKGHSSGYLEGYSLGYYAGQQNGYNQASQPIHDEKIKEN